MSNTSKYMEKLFDVISSGGIIRVRKSSGVVVEVLLEKDDDPDYQNLKEITRFDMKEWHEAYPKEEVPDTVDILDLGYWMKNNQYETPVYDWRAEFRKHREE